jgi:Protein of unknown function (DUF2783)
VRETTREAPVPLRREASLSDGDAIYAAIITAHADLSAAESLALNTRLILLLANHIGDGAILREALATARTSLGK